MKTNIYYLNLLAVSLVVSIMACQGTHYRPIPADMGKSAYEMGNYLPPSHFEYRKIGTDQVDSNCDGTMEYNVVIYEDKEGNRIEDISLHGNYIGGTNVGYRVISANGNVDYTLWRRGGPGAFLTEKYSGNFGPVAGKCRLSEYIEASKLEEAFWSAYQFFKDKNYDEAVRRFSDCANKGHAGCAHYMSMAYLSGFGIKKDFTESMKWAQRAYDTGTEYGPAGAWAARDIGLHHELGLGVKRDLDQALTWYKKSQELSSDKALRRWIDTNKKRMSDNKNLQNFLSELRAGVEKDIKRVQQAEKRVASTPKIKSPVFPDRFNLKQAISARTIGNPEARHKVKLYMRLINCPPCVNVFTGIMARKWPDDLDVYLEVLIVPFSPGDVMAEMMARGANPGKYFMVQGIFLNQFGDAKWAKDPWALRSALAEFAKERGASFSLVEECLGDEKLRSHILAGKDLARADKIRGVPVFVSRDKQLTGAVTLQQFAEWVRSLEPSTAK